MGSRIGRRGGSRAARVPRSSAESPQPHGVALQGVPGHGLGAPSRVRSGPTSVRVRYLHVQSGVPSAVSILSHRRKIRTALNPPPRTSPTAPSSARGRRARRQRDRKSTRLNSSHGYISYAVFCLKKKNKNKVVQAHTSRLVDDVSSH